jgi:hypothetical protein
MKQFKALIIKEWHTHFKQMLIPLWALAALYVLSLVVFIYGTIRYDAPTVINASTDLATVNPVIFYVHFIASVLLGWLVVLTSMQLADATLNQDRVKNCEIFHLSQPVSLIKMLCAKAVFVMLGGFILYIILALINSLVMSGVFGILGFNSLAQGLNGLLNALPETLYATLTPTPLLWFFASIFRKNAFGHMVLVFAVVELVLYIMGKTWNLNLFSPMQYYLDLLVSIKVSGSAIQQTMSAQGVSVSHAELLSGESLGRLGVSAVMLIASYFLIKRREVR